MSNSGPPDDIVVWGNCYLPEPPEWTAPWPPNYVESVDDNHVHEPPPYDAW
jgi:hypothetical protein